MASVVAIALALAGAASFVIDVRQRGRLPGRWSLVEVYNQPLGSRGWLGLGLLACASLVLSLRGNW